MKRKPASAAERIAAHRARGRTVTVTLTDRAQIEQLDRLVSRFGGVKPAIVFALESSSKVGWR